MYTRNKTWDLGKFLQPRTIRKGLADLTYSLLRAVSQSESPPTPDKTVICRLSLCAVSPSATYFYDTFAAVLVQLGAAAAAANVDVCNLPWNRVTI